MRKLSYVDRIDEPLLFNVEHLNPVVSGIADVDLAARLIEHDVLQRLAIIQAGRHREYNALLILLPVVHVDANYIREIDCFQRRKCNVDGSPVAAAGICEQIGPRLPHHATPAWIHR